MEWWRQVNQFLLIHQNHLEWQEAVKEKSPDQTEVLPELISNVYALKDGEISCF